MLILASGFLLLFFHWVFIHLTLFKWVWEWPGKCSGEHVLPLLTQGHGRLGGAMPLPSGPVSLACSRRQDGVGSHRDRAHVLLPLHRSPT